MHIDAVAEKLEVFDIHENTEFYIEVFKEFYVKLPYPMKWSGIHEMMKFVDCENIVCLTPDPMALLGREEQHEEETDMLKCRWQGTVLIGASDDPRSHFEFDLKSFIANLENSTGHHR